MKFAVACFALGCAPHVLSAIAVPARSLCWVQYPDRRYDDFEFSHKQLMKGIRQSTRKALWSSETETVWQTEFRLKGAWFAPVYLVYSSKIGADEEGTASWIGAYINEVSTTRASDMPE